MVRYLLSIFVVSFIIVLYVNRKKRQAKTRLIVTFINNKKVYINMAKIKILQLLVGTVSLINKATGESIPATFANETFTSSDESIATVKADPSDTPETAELDVTGVSEGTAVITVTTDATYIDPNTKESVTKTKTITVDVTITKGEAETELVVTFGEPIPVETEEPETGEGDTGADADELL